MCGGPFGELVRGGDDDGAGKKPVGSESARALLLVGNRAMVLDADRNILKNAHKHTQTTRTQTISMDIVYLLPVRRRRRRWQR